MSQDFVKGLQTDTDVTLAANKDTRVATQKAVKAYVAAAVSGVNDQTLPTSNITTNDVSNTKHGFVPPYPVDPTKFFTGAGTYAVPFTDDWERWYEAFLIHASAGSTDVGGATSRASGTITASGATSGQPSCVNLLSAATSGTTAYIGSEITATGQQIVGRPGRYQAVMAPVDTTSVQVWVGMTALANASQIASDAPVGNYAMFRFTAGDTNWKFVIGDGATTETFDTGVSVASTITTMARFEIRWDGTATNSFLAYINGSLVATGTKNPAAATLLHFITMITPSVNTGKNLRYFSQRVWQKWSA